MTTLQIDLQKVPSQDLSVTLNGQSCVINLRELNDKQYFSLSVSGAVICQNVLSQHAIPLISADYLGFYGEFYVMDLNGVEPPNYTGWGDRWVLLYNAV